MARDDLNAKQRAFVFEYLVDLNATQAAIRAGYSKRTARQIGEENLTKPSIKEALAKAMSERECRTKISQDRVLIELARLAFFDIGKAFTTDGTLRPIHEIDEDTRRALIGLEIVELRAADDAPAGTLKKVKLANKIEALDKLMKHLGMFSPVRVKFDDPISVLVKQVQGSSFKTTETNEQPAALVQGDGN
ncbi:terminase small subunit [Methylosinus sp. LW3]|uniref:terminase small subunit n=1 Tax=Methylosinus sp. LW3 TaxID=107635 RepID=UPI000A034AC6|nr:terminase small subunit [Methylosinus sp. LW3]